MSAYDKVVIDTFLKDQLKLYPEKVAYDAESAEDFLDMMLAVVCKNQKETRKYLKDAGIDVSECDMEEFSDIDEVFPLPDGRYLIVEA